jgi:nucleoside-diphosphate-sugar epimerase
MKIVITGATGSLGAALTRYFSKAGHEVTACGRDKNPPSALLNYAQYHCADINQPFYMPEADACIHTAAISDEKARYAHLLHSNVQGTLNTLRAADKCRTFVHISSSSVYLPQDDPITENLAGNQNNNQLSSYGRSKLESEKALLKNIMHENCFVLRPRAFYGTGDRVILPRILKLVEKDIFRRPGSMEISVSLTHYDNIARATELCLASGKKGVSVYNVADDHPYILLDVVRKIIAGFYGRPLMEKEINIRLLRMLAALRIGGISPLMVRSFTKNMVLDVSKIKKELGYIPLTDFNSQVQSMTDWVRRIGGVDVLRTGDKKLAWVE